MRPARPRGSGCSSSPRVGGVRAGRNSYSPCVRLFDDAAELRRAAHAPLADRLRPQALDEFAGQPQLVGEGAALRRAIEEDRVGSSLFFGPPGTGKTTLARIVAASTQSVFEELSAVS